MQSGLNPEKQNSKNSAESTETQFFRGTDYASTRNALVWPDNTVRAALARFMDLKRKDPTQRFGKSDRLFISGAPLANENPGLSHAHMGNRDISLVYRVSGNKVYLYGFYTHQDLGTSDTSNISKQKSMASHFKKMTFTEDTEDPLYRILELSNLRKFDK